MAADEAKTPLEVEVQGTGHEEEEFKRRFWDKRPDGMVLDKEGKVCYVMEFKRAFERYRGVHRRKRIKKQNDSMTIFGTGVDQGTKGGEWRVTLVVFVGGMCGSVEAKAFNTNMELMGVIESERNKLFHLYIGLQTELLKRLAESQWKGKRRQWGMNYTYTKCS